MNAVELIVKKREGEALAAADVRALVAAYTEGDVPDYQMSAFLMAACLRGLGEAETSALTEAMLHSGRVLDLSSVPGVKVGKHSTGGVGDKISLVLAPVVAACGVPVPKISGRGLGHTGGTLDKLESIPGLRTGLSTDVYRRQLEKIGLVMIGQTGEIAPADRKLYALRDVTGTVESVPLIAASIMSKKLAEGIDALVLDVKCGRGAFMKTEADARRLAETLVAVGERAGKKTVAHLTHMDIPLGRAVGNWPEVAESVRCLQGEGPADVMAVTLALAGEMLHLGGMAGSPEAGREKAQDAIDAGRAFEKFAELVEAQGGDVSALDKPDVRQGAPAADVRAPSDVRSYVAGLDALAIGHAAVALGAGRRRKEDAVDPLAGLVLHKKPGADVRPGDLLAELYTRKTEGVDGIAEAVRRAYTFAEAPPAATSVLLDRLAGGRWANR